MLRHHRTITGGLQAIGYGILTATLGVQGIGLVEGRTGIGYHRIMCGLLADTFSWMATGTTRFNDGVRYSLRFILMRESIPAQDTIIRRQS